MALPDCLTGSDLRGGRCAARRRLLALLLSWTLSGWTALAAGPAERILYSADFELGPALASYPGLRSAKTEAAVVAGEEGQGHCLRLRTPGPEGFCSLDLAQPVTMEKNLVLAFDHREEIEPGYEGAYLGIAFFVDGQEWFWTSDAFSPAWRRCEVPLARLRSSTGKSMRPGLVFNRIQLYGRVKEQTPVKGRTKARLSVWFDNISLQVTAPASRLTTRSRLSWSNPPLFNWTPAPEPGRQRLQYWLEGTAPSAPRTEVEVTANFHTPPAPLAPGTYQWRIWSSSALEEGWADIERMVVPEETHRFVTAPVPREKLAAAPHPRLLPSARRREPELTEKRRAQLLQTARKLFEQGVPEHPGPHVEGDPRWPTWIEWYGKVAGSITGGTGRRLEEAGRIAMITGDAQAVSWAKDLALAVCAWDPEGGSAMRRGDIGAHHLLRGLNWCYDASCAAMTEAEREQVKSILARRAEQFHDSLNPFRHGEANNHAWLQAFGLAETGLVLLGEHPSAGDWAEYVRQLYLGRFLPCLGFQGDNNEGISYWDYGLSFVVPYADLLRDLCGIDLFRHPWLQQTARFPLYSAPPGSWAVSFADTGMPNHGVRGPAAVRWVRELALRTRDPYALWYAGAREPVDGLAPRPPLDLPASILYRHIGVAIFNTSLVDGREGVTVALHSGPYQAGHQHPDQNSFVIHAYGGKLAIDGGYYDWYGSPHFKHYSMSTLAHNTLLVNGTGQAACTVGADGAVRDWFDAPGYGYVAGDASDPDIYGGALRRFERRLLFVKPGLVAVQDRVEATQEPSRFDWLLHAIAPFQVEPRTGSFSVAVPEAALRGRFLAPARMEMEVKTGFPAEPVNRYSRDPVPKDRYFPEWILHARPGAAAREEEFCAVMQVQRLGEKQEPEAVLEPVACEQGHAARIQVAGRTHFLLFRRGESQEPLRAADLETDGACAAIELSADGQALRAFLGSGTYLRWRQQDLVRNSVKGCGAFP